MKLPHKPTFEMYSELQIAFDHFNQMLFDNKLPECMITLQRESNSLGYYSVNRFVKKNGQKIDEIAMNPEYFSIRSIPETLSTLVHEMVHLQQEHFGAPGRGRYHNNEWANWMECVGLVASHTGKVGGRRTGDKMTHYIVHGAKFDQACQHLLTKDFTLSWMDRFPPHKGIRSVIQFLKSKPIELSSEGHLKRIRPLAIIDKGTDIDGIDRIDSDEESINKNLNPDTNSVTNQDVNHQVDSFLKTLDQLGIDIPNMEILVDQVLRPSAIVNKSNRIKYTCLQCNINVWGKPNINIICGECQNYFE